MFQRILVPLDGSAQAEHAIPVAIRLARASGGAVLFVHIVLPLSEIGEHGIQEEALPGTHEKRVTSGEQYLQQIIHTYARDLEGVHVEHEVETSITTATVFSIAHQKQIDLIVLCSHGAHHLFHWMFRSVARKAVHRSPVPILVLKESGSLFLESPQTRPIRMLVPLDGSPIAEAALQPALQLITALAVPGEVHLVHVIDLPSIEGKPLLRAYALKKAQEEAIQEAEDYLKEVIQRLSDMQSVEARLAVTWSIRVSTHVARTIAEMAKPVESTEQTNGYDLLAMATHQHAGFHLLNLDGVTEQVLGVTNLPLLIVQPPLRANGHHQERESSAETEREEK